MHDFIKRMFILIGVLVTLLTAGGIVFDQMEDHWPNTISGDDVDSNPGINAFRYLLENLVLISHTIPMSIYVAIEVLKYFQVRLILSDDELVT